MGIYDDVNFQGPPSYEYRFSDFLPEEIEREEEDDTTTATTGTDSF